MRRRTTPPTRHPSVRAGYVAGIAAALMFGASAPLAKRLGADVDAQLLAGLLYGGAFVGIAPVAAARWRAGRDTRLQRRDLKPLAGLILLGGVIAPVLLMAGLHRVSGVSGSLLLNLEGPFTAAIGVVAFREHLSRRAWSASLLIFGGAAALTVSRGPLGQADALGALMIVVACGAWAVDNNLTQVLTVRDPFAIVAVKTGAAAVTNVAIGSARNASWPSVGTIVSVMAVGAVGYGVSVVADAYALRFLGAVREAAVFAVAPFAGVGVSVVVLSERLSVAQWATGLVMAAGLAVIVRDRHVHHHHHAEIAHEHEHGHVHDQHHSHPHADATAAHGAHSHAHRHDLLGHSHDHVSDVHHRHAH